MKRFVLTALMTSAWLSFSTAATHVGHANESQPNVVIIGQEWFKNVASAGTRHSLFELSNESFLELPERYSILCPITRKPEMHSQGDCASEASAESGTESLKRADDFVYKVRIRNSGQKTVRAVLWDYVFIDPNTGKELARHTFYTESQLSPGKTKTLIATSVRPPTRVVTVEMLAGNEAATYREQVEIKHVEYADGSVWGKNQAKAVVLNRHLVLYDRSYRPDLGTELPISDNCDV